MSVKSVEDVNCLRKSNTKLKVYIRSPSSKRFEVCRSVTCASNVIYFEFHGQLLPGVFVFAMA